jgi:TolA-binding protein
MRNFNDAMNRSALARGLNRLFYKRHVLWGIGFGLLCILAATVIAVPHHDPILIHNKGMKLFHNGEFEKARTVFQKGMALFPLSPIIDQTAFHFAITYYKEENWEKALESFETMARDYPETRKLPEVLYHIGLCHLKLERSEAAIHVFRHLIADFPEDTWAKYAKERLQELAES